MVLIFIVAAAELVVSSVQPVAATSGGDIPSSEPPASVSLEIEAGDSAAEIARKLADKGLIRSPWPFLLWVKYRGIGGNLKSGLYKLHRGMDLFEIAREMETGQEPESERVTIVEGWRAEEIGAAFESRGIITKSRFMAEVTAASLNTSILSNRPLRSSLEGYLFPDTYELPKEVTARGLVELMVRNLDHRFTSEMRARASQVGLTEHQVITLASIVEREAGVSEERPVIAGVFLNRLGLGMPLAADPTVQYALSADAASLAANGYWKRQLTEQDLGVISPYNTYMNRGLPPNPISNPGMASIQAVLYPEQTDYLYFVVRKDGRHTFSATYEEHLRNVALAQSESGASP